MQNYKVSIAYDGSSFYGFQKQKNRPTVQGKIEEVLDLLIKDYDLNYSGRTDSGVHAKDQILNIQYSISQKVGRFFAEILRSERCKGMQIL